MVWRRNADGNFMVIGEMPIKTTVSILPDQWCWLRFELLNSWEKESALFSTMFTSLYDRTNERQQQMMHGTQSGVFWLLGRIWHIPLSPHTQDMHDHRDGTGLLDAISPGFEYPANCTSAGTAAAEQYHLFFTWKSILMIICRCLAQYIDLKLLIIYLGYALDIILVVSNIGFNQMSNIYVYMCVYTYEKVKMIVA